MLAGAIGRQRTLVGDVGALEAQFRFAQPDDVAGLEDVFADRAIVDDRAADTVEIPNDDARLMELDLTMARETCRSLRRVTVCRPRPITSGTPGESEKTRP